MKQQTLPLSLQAHLTFANFWQPVSQQLIVQKLQQVTPGEIIYLWGQTSSGLSHLAQATCHYWQQQHWHCLYLDLVNLHDFSDALPYALDGMRLIVLDHIETVLNNIDDEKLLFDIYNRALADNISLLWVAHHPPEQLACQLADLKSRLSAALILQLPTLSDEEKIQVLQQCAKQRGLELNAEVARYLLTHDSRELYKLIDRLAQLDTAALTAQRKLTIPFVKSFLD